MELCATAERRWKHLKKKGRREPGRLLRAFVKAAVPEMQVRRNGRSFLCHSILATHISTRHRDLRYRRLAQTPRS
jgi:hypothetical protein